MEDLSNQEHTEAAATSAIPISDGTEEGASLFPDGEANSHDAGAEPESQGDAGQPDTAGDDKPDEVPAYADAPQEPLLIVPTIGRRVWYWPSNDDIDHAYDPVLKVLDKAQAMDAGIVFVHDDRRVNLSVKDHYGKSFARLNVQLVQEGDTVPVGCGYAAWMPYQKSSAARKA